MNRAAPNEQDQIAAGEAAYWAANQREPSRGTWWLMGWDKAATEAALLLQGEGFLIKSGRQVREALTESQAALRQLIDIKTPFGTRRKAEGAIEACEAALRMIATGSTSRPAGRDSAPAGTRSGSRR